MQEIIEFLIMTFTALGAVFAFFVVGDLFTYGSEKMEEFYRKKKR